MKTYYTVDRSCQLQIGQILEKKRLTEQELNGLKPQIKEHLMKLFPDGISSFAHQYLMGMVWGNEPRFTIELFFEYVRRACAPTKPSRFESIFCWQTFEEAKIFRSSMSPEQKRSPIVKVEASNAFVANMSLLTVGAPLLYCSYFAETYWRGEQGPEDFEKKPDWECLINVPATVVEIINED